jgi:Flp pilus assembly protein TadG
MISRISDGETVGKGNKRFGTAVVELAFSLPLIVLIVFGSIEACNAIYLQQVVTEVAYQGALAGNQFDATEQSVLDRMQDYIDQTSFSGVTFNVVGTDGSTPFNDLVRGQSFRVTVTAPADSMPLTMQILSNLNDLSAARVAVRQ